jgi:nitrite reductase/ring-hydroxylating ferredoxin subunit
VSSEAPATGFVRVARVNEIGAGVPHGVEASGQRICLARVGDEIVAFLDQCTHREYPLSAGEVLEDGTIECPWHGARFDCRSGEVRQGPATQAVRTFEVRIVGDCVEVKI